MNNCPASGGKPAILSISSLVVRGTVGNRAIVPALEALGHPVWSLPTVILPWHPGHGPANRITITGTPFSAIVDNLVEAPWLGEIAGVVSGYLAAPSQAGEVARLVAAVKLANPAANYLCDPVIGDHGRLYVEPAIAAAIRDQLLPIADAITPNRFELEWLTGSKPCADNGAIIATAGALATPIKLVTSAYGPGTDKIGNLLIAHGKAYLSTHSVRSNPPNGLGDLMSALMMAHIITGTNAKTMLAAITGSCDRVLARTKAQASNELVLEDAGELLAQSGVSEAVITL